MTLQHRRWTLSQRKILVVAHDENYMIPVYTLSAVKMRPPVNLAMKVRDHVFLRE